MATAPVGIVARFPLSNVGRRTKKKELLMGTSKKDFFSSNTTFSTDVLQHGYIIYIYIFCTYIFSRLAQKSVMGGDKVGLAWNFISFPFLRESGGRSAGLMGNK